MDWKLLEPDEFAFIANSVKYAKQQCKAGELYSKMKMLSYSIECKVKFILQHWGWDGTRRKESEYIISAIHDSGFMIPENVKTFYEQLYGLMLPLKKEKIPTDRYGGLLRLRFAEKGDLQLKDWLIGAECLSAKFDDSILPIGYRLNYNGFSSSGQQLNGWENPQYHPCGAWGYELYLGSSGKVYIWDTETSNYIGVEAEDIVSFFASAFGLIFDTEHNYGYTSDADFALMEKIEELWIQGQYKQNYFRGKI